MRPDGAQVADEHECWVLRGELRLEHVLVERVLVQWDALIPLGEDALVEVRERALQVEQ